MTLFQIFLALITLAVIILCVTSIIMTVKANGLEGEQMMQRRRLYECEEDCRKLREMNRERNKRITVLEEKISQLEQKPKAPNLSEVLAKYFQESLDKSLEKQEQGDVNLVD